MPGLTSYFKNQLLDVFSGDALQLKQLYLALHFNEPGDTGSSEIRGRGYERQSISFAKNGSPDYILNVNDVNFRSMPVRDVTHAAVWDAKTGGNCLWWAPIPAAPLRQLAIGDGFLIPGNALSIRFS